LVAGIAHAGNSCDKFDIVLVNKTGLTLAGSANIGPNAEITPSIITGFEDQQTFTITAPTEGNLTGKFSLASISVPLKQAVIHYSLANEALGVCGHKMTTIEGDYSVTDSRSPNKVTYTIAPK